MSTTTTRIDATDWQITAVHDTREVEAQGDRLVRIPGSGQPRTCDHCGAGHEVHVTLSNWLTGGTMIVGTSCARGLRKSGKPATTFVHQSPVKVAAGAGWVEWRHPSTGETFRTGR